MCGGGVGCVRLVIFNEIAAQDFGGVNVRLGWGRFNRLRSDGQ